jgi:thiol:disulfide interchange protein
MLLKFMMNSRFVMLAGAVLSLGFASGCRPSSESASSAVETKPAVKTLARGRINFVEGFDNGCQLAREKGKPMLVFFTATWCHYCHAMADDAFTQDAVVNRADQFVCVLVDADAEPDVCRQFRVRGYPTVQFLSAQGAPLNRVTGKQPGHLLVMEMQAALQAVARRAPTSGGSRAL